MAARGAVGVGAVSAQRRRLQRRPPARGIGETAASATRCQHRRDGRASSFGRVASSGRHGTGPPEGRATVAKGDEPRSTTHVVALCPRPSGGSRSAAAAASWAVRCTTSTSSVARRIGGAAGVLSGLTRAYPFHVKRRRLPTGLHPVLALLLRESASSAPQPGSRSEPAAQVPPVALATRPIPPPRDRVASAHRHRATTATPATRITAPPRHRATTPPRHPRHDATASPAPPRHAPPRHRATAHRAPGTGHRAPGTGHRAPGTGHRAPAFSFHVKPAGRTPSRPRPRAGSSRRFATETASWRKRTGRTPSRAMRPAGQPLTATPRAAPHRPCR